MHINWLRDGCLMIFHDISRPGTSKLSHIPLVFLRPFASEFRVFRLHGEPKDVGRCQAMLAGTWT
jgi:hypothetical protein